MPTLAELRSQLPELQGLSDDQAVDAVQQAFYPDFSRDEIARDLGVKIAPPPPPPTPERTLGSNLKDIGVAAMRGGVGAVESVVGLGNLVSGGQAGKLVEDVGIDLKGAKKYWGEGFSDAQKAAFKKVEDAEGLWEVVKAAVKNPSVAGLSLVESVPLILVGSLAARGMVAGATALSPRLAAQMATARAAPFVASAGARANTAAIPIVAGALGEGVVGAGSAAEQIRQQSGTGTLTGDQALLALATGAANAAFGLIGGKVAQSMGLKDIDTLLAGAASNPRAAKGVVRRVLEGFVSEGLLEELPQSISEQVMQNMALGRPLDEGVNQAAVLGLMAGGIMGAGANVMSGGQPARPGPSDILAAPDVDTAIKTAEQAIPKPAAPVPTPEIVIPPNPVGDTLTGSSMADLLQRQTDPLSRTAQQPAPTLTGNTPADLLTGQAADPLQGLARDNALAREDQRQEDRTGQVVDNLTRGAAEDAQSVRQWDARRQPVLPELDAALQPNDVLQKNGAPWPEAGAKLHLKAVLKGQGEIVPVAGGGYIVRPKKKEQPDEKITGIAGGAGVNQAVAQGNAAAPEPVPAGLPGAELENGFRQGPAVGERYRVSDISATGGLMLEKRLPAGTVASFYVGKDGGFVDGDTVNLIGSEGRERLWIPENDQDRQEARDILQEMGALALTDPKRAALKARLKALVTKAPDAKSPAAAPAPAAPAGRQFQIGGRDPHTRSYTHRPDGRLTRTVTYPDGTAATETLVTTKDGEETWVSNERYEKGEFYPKQLTNDEAQAAIREDLPATAAPAAPAPVPAPAGPAEAGRPQADRAVGATGDQPAADAKPALTDGDIEAKVQAILDGRRKANASGQDGADAEQIRAALKAQAGQQMADAGAAPVSEAVRDDAAEVRAGGEGAVQPADAQPADVAYSVKPNGDGQYMVEARAGGAVIGRLAGTVKEVGGKLYLSIDDVMVRDEHQGKGVGIRLYEHAIDNLPSGIDGLLSEDGWRKNDEQVPKIHARLTGRYSVEKAAGGTVFAPRSQAAAGQDYGVRWTRMTAAERSAVLDRTAAKDKAKARIVNQSWDDLADGWRRAIARSMGELQAAAPTVSRETPPASQEVSGVSERAQTGNTSVRELALQEQRDAGWNTDWPFIPADLLAADFRDLIRNDPSMDAAEKERIMSAGKKLGVVPANETQPRDPESGQFVDAGVGAVKVPPTVDAALTADMSKQQARVKRLRSAAEADGQSLEEKKAALLKATAAEATLRRMRTTRFDAEDAAVAAVAAGDLAPFAVHADIFPSAAQALGVFMGKNDELDAEMQAYEAGLTAQTRADKPAPAASDAVLDGWWGNGGISKDGRNLTAVGRTEALAAIGYNAPMMGAKVRWAYLPEQARQQLAAMHAQGWEPAAAPAPTAASAAPVSRNAVAARDLLAEYTKAVRDGEGQKALAAIKKRAQTLASNTPATDEAAVLALDMLATRMDTESFAFADAPALAAPTNDKPALLAELREKLSALADRTTKIPGSGKLEGQLRGFTVGMRDTDLNLTRQWVDEVVAQRTKTVEKLEKNAPAPSANTIFTDDMAAAARARLKAKLGRLGSGIDPEMLQDGIVLAGNHIERGARTFAAYAKAMLDDMGEAIRPYLKQFYMAVKYDPRAGAVTKDMSSAAFVEEFDLDAIAAPSDTGAVESQQPSADTGGKGAAAQDDEKPEPLFGANDDTRRNAAVDDQPLDDQLPGPGQGNGTGGNAEAGGSLRAPDADGNGQSESGGAGRGNGLDGSAQPVLPGTPAEVRPLADGPVNHTEDRPRPLAGENPGNFTITDAFGLGTGTDGDKIAANLAALRTLRQVQAESRYPTADEQAAMARYVGWGGLKTVFDPKKEGANDQYGRAQTELKSLLNPAEYRAANGSIRNAHYTAQGVVDAMWRVVRHMGFKGGRVLEPTVGIGNFIGRQPADMAASTEWHASELDTVTGQMAAMLYPEANVLAATGFQDAPFADGAFDLSIGNPPFGQQPITDKNPHRKHLSGMKIHNYIIAKTGMHLRPGGVMAMVVTHRFLDTANPEARDVLAKDFKFLGAFRLPNDAFAANAGTEVVTDVVFLQKLRPDQERNRDAHWLHTDGSIEVDGQSIRVNRYYQENPTHILGRSAMDGTMYAGRKNEDGSGEYTVHSDGRDIGQAIDQLIEDGKLGQMTENALVRNNNDMAQAPAMLAQSDLPVGGVMLDDAGKIMRRELNDSYGNAVVQEITPETLWKEQAAEWQALRQAVVDVKEAAEAGTLTPDDAAEVLALSKFLYKSDGTEQGKPSKATEGIYKLVNDLATPGAFKWSHADTLTQITITLGRKKLGEDGYRSLKGMLDLRNRTLALIKAEQADAPDMEQLRAELNTAYDAFVKANGFLSDPANANLLEGDVGAEAGLEASYTAAVSAAVAKSSGTPARKASAKKADILSTRVNFPYKEISKADSAADALFASLSEHGKVDLPYMAKITDKTVVQVIQDLTEGDHPQLFQDPESGEYQEAERYLSGNVKHKLAVARASGIEANVKALEQAQPEPKTRAQVKPNIRGMWMPTEIFKEFLEAIGYNDPTVTAIQSQGILSGSGERVTLTDLGIQFRHSKRTPMDMFNSAASGKPIKITVRTSDGKTYTDEQGTKEVNALTERMAKVFQEWAYSNDSRAERIVAAFNENMNTHTPRSYDGSKYLKPVGASPSIALRRTQKDAGWRMMQEKTILLDHVVGAGKTYTIITGIMERRRMGLSRKPMVMVPNHLVTQWARDFYKLYPGAKVLAANPADFARKNRRRLLARIATGDYDAVIVGHTSVGFMETPGDDLRTIIDEKLAGLKEALAEARRSKESKRTLGQIEDRIDRYEQKLKELSERTVDDIGIDFKSLGVDYLAVDEAHEFKNLEYSTSGDRVVGMNDPKGSKKAFDLYGKVRGLLARGGGVAFATGTPVSNSLVEIYTVMSYLAHDELKLRGQEHFDSWSGAYAATETRLEYTATQKLKPRRVLAGLNNLSALRQLYEQFADIITMSDLKRIHTEEMVEKNKKRKADGEPELRTDFPVPKVAGGRRQLESLPITDSQREYMDYLVARMGAIERNKGDKEYARIDNPLNVLTDARKMSLDVRIVDPGAARDENGKVATAAKRIMDNYKKWMDDRGTQLVFCDLSTPAKTAEKDAKRIISEVADKLYGKDAKRIKTQISGQTFEKQWQMLAERAEELAEDGSLSEDRRDDIATFMAAIEDPEATMNVADIGFSVYDDLRSLLVEKGIPESEIAFIHDYNTPEQKERLFDRVNNGYVRVLLGSSMKMGAGMNAQQRLVALHHMDAPWRPSDVEQREGRIIRQGNLLYARDPDGFDVEIKAYSTQNTSDTVMWQILERKSGAIEQFREGGLDSVEEEGGDSDQYAEFMATSTGNPVFRQKLEAERLLTELDAEIGGALITRSNATAFLERYPMAIAEAQRRLESAQAYDASTASYGGESGTAEEFEAAMKAANDDYLERYAAWTEKKAAAELELAKWELELELTRGKKPTMPTMPSQPNLMTKSVREASGYARAMALALQESKQDKSVLITMGAGKIQIEGSKVGEQMLWSITASHQGVNFHLENSSADSPSASSRLMTALTPRSVRGAMEYVANSEAGTIDSLTRQKKEADKNRAIAVDTRKRDAAREELNWLKAQVSFAEMKTDIERGERNNRFIARDRRRALGQAEKLVLKPIQSFEVDGANYTTTGIEGRVEYAVVLEATRDSDKLPVLAVEQFEGQGANRKSVGYSVIEQPKSLRKSLRNLAQMGSEEANTADVVFSQAAFRQGAPAKGERRSAAMLQYEADAITDLWRRKPTVIAVDSWRSNGVPAAVRREAEERISRGGAAPRAVFADGRVYLFAEALDSKTMPESLYHEVLGHYGLRGHFGEELDRELEMVATLRQADMRRIFEQTGMDPNNAANRIRAAEEVVVYLAQTRPNLSVVQRIVAAIRNWLRANVPGFKDMELSDADIIQKYILPARQYVEGGGPRGPGGKTTMEPAFQGGDANRPFYSALARGIEGLTAKALPVEGWRGAVNNLVNTGKAKADEVEWSGLREWLEMQTGKVSKDDVLNYLQANGVQVQEVTLKSAPTMDQVRDKYMQAMVRAGEKASVADQLFREMQGFAENGEYDDAMKDRGFDLVMKDGSLTGNEIHDAASNYDGGDTKHGQWVLPGGQNYREVLLTLPGAETTDQILARMKAKYPNWKEGQSYKTVLSEADQRDLEKASEKTKQNYRSSHWDQPNVIAHIRLNDRTDADGNRVLFVEEVQSDWAQEGKKYGFKDVGPQPITALPSNIVVREDATRGAQFPAQRFYTFNTDTNLRQGFSGSTEEQAISAALAAANIRQRDDAQDPGNRVPTAPFVGKTDAWVTLALKRIVKMAVDGGYDRVAFVTGKQSADRYSLRQQVDQVSYDRVARSEPAAYRVKFVVKGERTFKDAGVHAADKLESVVGKEVAKRILEDESGSGVLRDQDLEVGGEGMMAFYDKIVPAAANKLLAKLGGGKMASIPLVQATKAFPDGTQQPGFDITPAMREKAAGGLPLFQQRRADQTETPEFRAWFKESKVVDAEGKPLVVYHGSGSDISQFQSAAAQSRELGTEAASRNLTNANLSDNEGIYFTANPAVAHSYARGSIHRGGSPVVYPVYLKMKKPFVIPERDGFWTRIKEALQNKADPMRGVVATDSTANVNADEVARLRRKGYDGIVNEKTSEIIVFEPTQIKSATGNRGTFDPANPNIMFQQAIDDGGEFAKENTARRARNSAKAAKYAGWTTEQKQQELLKQRRVSPEVIRMWQGKPVDEFERLIENKFERDVMDLEPLLDSVGNEEWASDVSPASEQASKVLSSLTVANIKRKAGNTATDYRGLALGALGRRQLVDLYADDLPQLKRYNSLVQSMDADKNESGAAADDLARRWAKLKDETELANLMHDATLAKIDPDKELVEGDDELRYKILNRRFNALSDEAKAVYREARDQYEEHYAQVQAAIRERIERSEMSDERKAKLLARMDGEFFERIKGVYFPLARFGKYVVVVKDAEGETTAMSRAETMTEAEEAREFLMKKFPADKGYAVAKIQLSAEFNAARDGVGRGFLKELFNVLDNQGVGAELQDAVNQLYLSSLPDLSWAKHGIHRKGTPGFSQDARRAYAQNVFHGARYLAKLRYADQLQALLDDMQKSVKESVNTPGADSVLGQQIVDEMVKRHDTLMNPQSNSLSTTLTSLGFVFHMGLSPASAVVNLTGTPMVAYPLMASKWGYARTGKELLSASQEAAASGNDLRKVLKDDEAKAFDAAVKAGTIDVTMSHDLAGIAQGEDTGVAWKLRPVMRAASFFFHHAERFNRQVTFIAAYRLARGTGANFEQAYEQATEAVYQGHFDYSSSNRPRFMQGNVARVLLLFKQYAQNMVYTLSRQAYLSTKGETPERRAEARRAFAGLLMTHALGAGVLGLPLVGTLLSAASWIGGDDDEPWDAEDELRNALAEAIGQKPAEALTRGLSRLTPWDISGRVGLDKLIFPDIQEGLEGARAAEAAMSAALGPVAGIGINVLRGLQKIGEGDWARGLEDMMPSVLRAPLKAIRYADEGAMDRTGIPIKEDVGAMGILGQALGFSPSEVRNAQEGKSAILSMERRLNERRRALLQQYSKAMVMGDTDGAADAREDIQEFNRKQPEYRITPKSMLTSVASRRKRQREAEQGIYLPRAHQGVREAGKFALGAE